MTYAGMGREGEIIVICGHKWQFVDTRFTHAGPTYKLQDVINANGNVPQIQRFACSNNQEGD